MFTLALGDVTFLDHFFGIGLPGHLAIPTCSLTVTIFFKDFYGIFGFLC